MIAAQHAFRAFVWFFYQCSIVGGLGAGLFWIPTIGILAFMVMSFRKSPSAVRKRFWWLSVLPALWIFVGLWGGFFWVDVNPSRYHPNPWWVVWPVQYGLLVFMAVAAILIIYIRQGRTFVALFVAINLYLMLGMTFMAGMAVTGDWL